MCFLYLDVRGLSVVTRPRKNLDLKVIKLLKLCICNRSEISSLVYFISIISVNSEALFRLPPVGGSAYCLLVGYWSNLLPVYSCLCEVDWIMMDLWNFCVLM